MQFEEIITKIGYLLFFGYFFVIFLQGIHAYFWHGMPTIEIEVNSLIMVASSTLAIMAFHCVEHYKKNKK